METAQRVYLARHGETEWSLTGRHTGRTDMPLTARGEDNARLLGTMLSGKAFAKVWCSPSSRAKRTCTCAGFGGVVEIDMDLQEWDYGAYEGLKSVEIREKNPGWDLFKEGCPGGESPADIGARADRVVGRLRGETGDVLVFSSGHFLRVLTARWLGLPVEAARYFALETATLSIVGYEHAGNKDAVIRLWNRSVVV